MIKHLVVAGLAVAVAGCTSSTETPSKAIAVLEARSGSTVQGAAVFTALGGQVTVQLYVTGAAPGQHGVHLHDVGDCSAADATSAGGHWNPAMSMHGAPGSSSHLGDLGNLEVGADGTGTLRLTSSGWTVGSGAPTDLIGHAVIVHASADDLTTQPTGNSGGRVACGVIRRVESGGSAMAGGSASAGGNASGGTTSGGAAGGGSAGGEAMAGGATSGGTGFEVRSATAQLWPRSSSGVSGTATFTTVDSGVELRVQVSRLTPGAHGFHLHAVGDCSDPLALSAGGHWNVGDGGHGDPMMTGHHTGDLGNLTAAADGTASLVFTTNEWVVDAPFVGGVRQSNDVVGRAVIVHAAPDDLVTQPTGNSGGRLACGVIGLPAPAPTTALARIDPRSGSLLSGRATFRQTAAGVALQLDVSGVSPGPHAIHVHDRGDCSGFDGLTAGPHWNPDSMMHGLPDGGVHHLGDLGNLDIASDGTGSFSFTNPGWDIVGANSVLGHAFVVHGGTDDGTSQPAGDAGPRIGCGLITLDNQQPAAPRSVDFVLSPKSGSTATGRLRLVETGNAITAQVEVFNVPPGPHGVHLHANPDCSAADGTSAGGHWNPDNAMHGLPTLGHVGDMGNIDVDATGHGVLTMLSPRWMMGDGGVVMAPLLPDGGPDSRYPDGGWVRYDLMGHALILHAGTDDLMTQPTGDAGARIACGVLR